MAHKTESSYDVIVVGFGAAGAAAAIQAADAGARVLVLDRGYGGGASALSGGVVYAGGGTQYQADGGFTDTPENMFRYLRQEVDGVVSDETLRLFCEESPAMIGWLEEQGASYRGTVAPYKTSYPTDEHYLYFSGNEKAYPYKLEAEPAPRGHRQIAKGLSSGAALFGHLRDAALRRGVTFVPLARVHELIIENGRVLGVRYRVLSSEDSGGRHRRLSKIAGKLGNWAPPIGAKYNARAEKVWEAGAVAKEARADAVVLSAGGFVYNPEMMAEWAGPFADISPLGTVGDDGTGIRLGVSAGGTTAQMDRMTAWRFMSPPSGLIEGISVGLNGRRIRNEDLYGATHSDAMIHEFDAKGRLILDSRQWKLARKQIRSQTQSFQAAQALYLFTVGHKKASTLEKLARKTGVDPQGLITTVREYNEGIAGPDGDPGHKAADIATPIVDGPFYAIDISIKNAPTFPAPGLTLGGLRVDEASGGVLDEQNRTIPGLYAAGRNAVGICSNSYISGLSLADCIFSGRRAGAHSAAQSKSTAQSQSVTTSAAK